MLYLLAAIGVLAILYLLWRAFGPEKPGTSSAKRTLAPDDDPDFLRKLGEQQRRRRKEEDK